MGMTEGGRKKEKGREGTRQKKQKEQIEAKIKNFTLNGNFSIKEY